MVRSYGIPQRERYGRMAIGAGFVGVGFLLRRDAFAAMTLVTVGSTMVAAVSLGYGLSLTVLGASIFRRRRGTDSSSPGSSIPP